MKSGLQTPPDAEAPDYRIWGEYMISFQAISVGIKEWEMSHNNAGVLIVDVTFEGGAERKYLPGAGQGGGGWYNVSPSGISRSHLIFVAGATGGAHVIFFVRCQIFHIERKKCIFMYIFYLWGIFR